MSADPSSRHLFEWEDVGGIAVVRFTTNVLREERIIRLLFEQVEQLVDSGRARVVFNFAGMQAFASYAIGKLISLNAKLAPPAGRLALCCLTPIIDEIIDIMSLRKRFYIHKTEREAIESFS
ncbi:MAG: STAS domain-containing protein [Gemmataceae bacterium]|nr:STAS domain-containing protein [Gemmataceae bacterium]